MMAVQAMILTKMKTETAHEELEKRYEGIVNVSSWYEAFLIDMNSEKTSFASTNLCVFYWCKCGNCRTENLVGAREFRCCKELSPVLAKLALEGLEVKCIREHNEYDPLTHKAVLLNVRPLLRGKDGKKHKHRGKSQSSENEYVILFIQYSIFLS